MKTKKSIWIKIWHWILGIPPTQQNMPTTLTKRIYDPEQCPLRVVVTQLAWTKMQEYVRQCRTEMGAHLIVEDQNSSRILVVRDLYVPYQDVTSASYKPNQKELAKYPQILPHIKGWFHSHVNFGAFWSPDDETTIENSILGKYWISIVMNKSYEFKIRVDIRTPNSIDVYDNLKLEILMEKNEAIEKECREELKLKIKHGVFDFLRLRK